MFCCYLSVACPLVYIALTAGVVPWCTVVEVMPTVTFTDEGIPSESEEERKLQEARSSRLRQLIG